MRNLIKFHQFIHKILRGNKNLRITKGHSSVVNLQQEAHRPRLAHLSEIATADMQMLCNTFLILSLQLMTGSSFMRAILGFEEEECSFYYYHHFTIYGHASQWSVPIWTNFQSGFNSRIDMKLGGNWPTDFWRECLTISWFYACIQYRGKGR